MRDYTFKLARALKVIGLMNVQFAIPRSELTDEGHRPGGQIQVYVLK
jgi:hypothetical protein